VYPPIVARQWLGDIPLIVARQRLGKNSPYRCEATAWKKYCRGNEYIRDNRTIVGRVVFNVARVVSRKVGKYFFQELLVFIIKWEREGQ
jgi:hypothetical protein